MKTNNTFKLEPLRDAAELSASDSDDTDEEDMVMELASIRQAKKDSKQSKEIRGSKDNEKISRPSYEKRLSRGIIGGGNFRKDSKKVVNEI
jgi:hypothetical protein